MEGRAEVVRVGYFAEWGIYQRGFHVTNIAAELLTHVNYAFLRPVYDPGSDTARLEFFDRHAAVERSYPGDEGEPSFRGNLRQLVRLKQRYPHLRTLLSVGGATLSDDFSDIAASSTARRAFAESCVDHVVTYGFDGVDVDWEFPVAGGEAGLRHRPEDRENLVFLLREVRTALDARGATEGRRYLLTLASSIAPGSLTNRYLLSELAGEIDWFNVMGYRLVGAWSKATGHQAPLRGNPLAPAGFADLMSGLESYRAAGVPAEKLVLGIPLYGLGFQGVSEATYGLYQDHEGGCEEGSWTPGEFDYRDLREGSQGHRYLGGAGFVEAWDERSAASFLYHPDRRVFITYEGPRSAALKADYVIRSGFRGVMFWSLDADTSDYELQRVVNGVLGGRNSATSAPAHLRVDK